MTISRRMLVLLTAVVVTVSTGAVVYRKLLYWKRFAEVRDGVLYRSGALRDWQLRRAIERYGIKTVFALTFTNNAQEQQVCDEAGIRRYFCYLSGDGVGPDDPYLRFLQIIEDPANRPVLVHCSAGVQRTGGAVALYRMLMEGWSFDRAIDEMIAVGNEGKPSQIDQIRRIYDLLHPARLADRSGI